jgi:hypothetical protein
LTSVTTTASTKITVTTKATSASLADGDTVRALGTVTNGQLAANSIEIGSLADLSGGFGGAGGGRPAGGYSGYPGAGGYPGTGGPGPGGYPGTGEGAPTGSVPAGGAGRFTPITGTVSDVTSDSFTLTESTGTAGKVTFTSSTTFTVIKTTTLAGLTVGQTVVVTGTKSSSGAIAATAISQGNAFGAGGFGRFGGSTTTTG